jgi:spore coat polysaccharide biosynthesis predicted glycosyltransferase SpsG
MKKLQMWLPGIAYFLILSFLLVLNGCGKSDQQIKIDTEYKAVFLDNGQVFFGKVEETGPSYLMLKDVFYVQSEVVQQDRDKREVRNILIKRGSEWHGPDLMYIITRHVVVIEPVSPSSRVAQLIKEAKAQKP